MPVSSIVCKYHPKRALWSILPKYTVLFFLPDVTFSCPLLVLSGNRGAIFPAFLQPFQTAISLALCSLCSLDPPRTFHLLLTVSSEPLPPCRHPVSLASIACSSDCELIFHIQLPSPQLNCHPLKIGTQASVQFNLLKNQKAFSEHPVLSDPYPYKNNGKKRVSRKINVTVASKHSSSHETQMQRNFQHNLLVWALNTRTHMHCLFDYLQLALRL